MKGGKYEKKLLCFPLPPFSSREETKKGRKNEQNTDKHFIGIHRDIWRKEVTLYYTLPPSSLSSFPDLLGFIPCCSLSGGLI